MIELSTNQKTNNILPSKVPSKVQRSKWIFWISGRCEDPRGKFSDLSARLLPEIFDRVAFERELKGNFASRGPSLRRGAHQKPQTRSRGSGGVRARVESEGTLRAPRARSALLPRNRARHAVRRRAVEWENSVLKVKIDQNENFQITRHS